MKSTIALFLITITLFFLKPQFFELLYNTVWGRIILISILIFITINSMCLAVILLLVIIFLSHNKKKVRFTKNIPDNNIDSLPMEEIVIKNYQEKDNEMFLFKKHKKVNYKSKRKNGVNVIQISEIIRPKSSKNMVITPNIPNIETTPYYNKSFYYI